MSGHNPENDWQRAHREKVASFPADIRDAHAHSIHHKQELLSSSDCGCFYCSAVFAPQQIQDWTDDGDTALCPRCGIDSVIGSAAGFPLTKEFLGRMKSYWF